MVATRAIEAVLENLGADGQALADAMGGLGPLKEWRVEMVVAFANAIGRLAARVARIERTLTHRGIGHIP